MSANHALLGPSALKSRFTRSAADTALAALLSPDGLLAFDLVVPRQPHSAIILATRLLDMTTPWALSVMNIFGAP